MNLRKKKNLAAKTLGVGRNRIVINSSEEIKEAITKQDIRDLYQQGIISIKPVKGRKKKKKRKTKRGPGKKKKTIRNKKQEYVKITRKIRKYLIRLKNKDLIEKDLYWGLRKKIRMRDFKNFSSFKDYIMGIENVKEKIESLGRKNKASKKKNEGKTNKRKTAGKSKKKKSIKRNKRTKESKK